MGEEREREQLINNTVIKEKKTHAFTFTHTHTHIHIAHTHIHTHTHRHAYTQTHTQTHYTHTAWENGALIKQSFCDCNWNLYRKPNNN